MMFNNSLNQALQLKQMDLTVQIWDGGGQVTGFYCYCALTVFTVTVPVTMWAYLC